MGALVLKRLKPLYLSMPPENISVGMEWKQAWNNLISWLKPNNQGYIVIEQDVFNKWNSLKEIQRVPKHYPHHF